MRKPFLCFVFVIFCLFSGCSRIPSAVSLSLSSAEESSRPLAASSQIDSSALSSAFDSSEAASVSSKAAVSSQKEESVSETTAEKPSSMATTSVPAPVYSAPKPVSGETKAVWVSQFDLQNVLKTNGAQRDQETFTALFGQMMDNIKSYGFNTVFLQARPYSDSFYPSEYFPWSDMVVSSFGEDAEYDPYGIMVTEARKRGLSVHGWINPLRAMTDSEIKLVDDRFPIKQWYNDPDKRGKNIVLKDGRWYYNSSVPEVRQLIADGAKELLSKYQLDGIHIDDYFYYSDSLDAVSAMVKEIYDAVKSVNSKAQFGVAPEGNVDRDYSVHFADVKTWCSEKGYIDYICPQIYYGMEHATHAFDRVVAEWNSFITEESGVYLLAGMTLGKAGGTDQYAGASGREEWQRHDDILKRSMIETRKQSHAAGFALFCYQYLFDPLTGAKVERTAAEVENFLPELKK